MSMFLIKNTLTIGDDSPWY